MPYKVINRFFDQKDRNYLYNTGDVFPRDGYTPSKERLNQLLKPHPKYDLRFIEEVESEEEKAEREVKEAEAKAAAELKAKEEAEAKAKAEEKSPPSSRKKAEKATE